MGIDSGNMDERRNVPRYNATLSARICLPGQDPMLVKVLTLAVKGCAIKGMGIPEVGKPCELVIQWQGREIPLGSQVAWKTREGMAGLRFVSVGEQDVEVLRELCSTLRLQPLAPMRTDD